MISLLPQVRDSSHLAEFGVGREAKSVRPRSVSPASDITRPDYLHDLCTLVTLNDLGIFFIYLIARICKVSAATAKSRSLHPNQADYSTCRRCEVSAFETRVRQHIISNQYVSKPASQVE